MRRFAAELASIPSRGVLLGIFRRTILARKFPRE
jgi:hypothetical protein